MSRSVKFRAYHPTIGWAHNIRVDCDGLCEVQWDGGSQADTSREGLAEWALSEFTGVHDKHGKEIYEGDTVVGYSHGGGKHFTAVVVFEKGEFQTFVKEWECQYSLGSWAIELEVIGNIYENANLIK